MPRMTIADIIFLASVSAMFALTTTILWRQRRVGEREWAEWQAQLQARNEALRQAREAWRR
jgi:hypothetical protein